MVYHWTMSLLCETDCVYDDRSMEFYPRRCVPILTAVGKSLRVWCSAKNVF